MHILMIGLNHRTAKLALRERLAVSGDKLDQAIAQFRCRYSKAELVIVSTCNRSEFYIARPVHESPSPEELIQFISEHFDVELGLLTAATIRRQNEQAVAHLFRVSAGLDAMVLGEPQILGQVKRAYEHATACGVVGTALHQLFQQAIAVAKQIRSETSIGEGRMSIGSVAVDFARQIFDHFDDKTVVGIGAGEMSKLVLRHLQDLKPATLWLTNRSIENATALAEKLGLGPTPGRAGKTSGGGGVRAFEDLDELLVEADIVLTCTAATEPIITAERFTAILKRRRRRPLFLIDIALPRDVDPMVGSLSNVYLYNLDDLQQAVTTTQQQRSEQIEQGEQIISSAVSGVMSRIQHHDISLLIRALRNKLHEVGDNELERTHRKLSNASTDDEVARIVAEHTNRLINKILHMPLSHLDSSDPEAPLGFYAAALRRLFKLDEHLMTPDVVVGSSKKDCR